MSIFHYPFSIAVQMLRTLNIRDFVIVDTGVTLGIQTAFDPAFIQAPNLKYGTDYDVIYRDAVTVPALADIVSPPNPSLARPVSQIVIKLKPTSRLVNNVITTAR